MFIMQSIKKSLGLLNGEYNDGVVREPIRPTHIIAPIYDTGLINSTFKRNMFVNW